MSDPHVVPPFIPPSPNLVEVAMSQVAGLCQLGYHAYVPWLDLGGKYVTYCTREGCEYREQYDT